MRTRLGIRDLVTLNIGDIIKFKLTLWGSGYIKS